MTVPPLETKRNNSLKSGRGKYSQNICEWHWPPKEIVLDNLHYFKNHATLFCDIFPLRIRISWFCKCCPNEIPRILVQLILRKKNIFEKTSTCGFLLLDYIVCLFRYVFCSFHLYFIYFLDYSRDFCATCVTKT